MRAFRIGYILTVSFMLVLAVVTLSLGYFPPPNGPKAPEYPTYNNFGMQGGAYNDLYTQQQNQYERQQKAYKGAQKTFIQSKIVPYAQNIFMAWITFLILFEIVGMLFVKLYSEVVGAAFAFSGVWAVIFGPLGGIIWFVNSLVASLGARAEQEFSVDPILQTVGLTTVLGVIALTVLGMYFFSRKTTPIVTP